MLFGMLSCQERKWTRPKDVARRPEHLSRPGESLFGNGSLPIDHDDQSLRSLIGCMGLGLPEDGS